MVREYCSVHFDYRGRGITQEFKLLDVNSQRLAGWISEGRQTARTLPEFLRSGEDDWELVSHAVNQAMKVNGVTWHYMQFKRPKR